MWVLLLALGAFVALIGSELYRKSKTKYDFKYLNIECRYASIPKKEKGMIAVRKKLSEDVANGYYSPERMAVLEHDYYKKPPRSEAVNAAVIKGIDAFKSYTPGYNWGSVEIVIQRYPISHSSILGYRTSHGVTYADIRKIYVTLMPAEKGGLASTASLVIHELGHLYKHDTNNRDPDRAHLDKPFWAQMDGPIT